MGAILTQNTSWMNVERAIGLLKGAKALSPHKIDAMDIGTLEGLIRPAGFFRVKAARLKAFVRYMMEAYLGNVDAMAARPGWELREELMAVPGIGEETADSILLYALDKPFFVVDAYTKRILERNGLIRGGESYGEIQRFFMDSLPGDVGLFKEYHALLVALGKTYCRARRPLCDSCPLRFEDG